MIPEPLFWLAGILLLLGLLATATMLVVDIRKHERKGNSAASTPAAYQSGEPLSVEQVGVYLRSVDTELREHERRMPPLWSNLRPVREPEPGDDIYYVVGMLASLAPQDLDILSGWFHDDQFPHLAKRLGAYRWFYARHGPGWEHDESIARVLERFGGDTGVAFRLMYGDLGAKVGRYRKTPRRYVWSLRGVAVLLTLPSIAWVVLYGNPWEEPPSVRSTLLALLLGALTAWTLSEHLDDF